MEPKIERGVAAKEEQILENEEHEVEALSQDGTSLDKDNQSSEKEIGHYRGAKNLAESLRIQEIDSKKHGRLRPIREIFNDSETSYFTKKRIQWIWWPQYSSMKKQREIIRATWETLSWFPETREVVKRQQESDLDDAEITKLITFCRLEMPEYFEFLEKQQHQRLFSLLDESKLHEQYKTSPNNTFLSEREIRESCIYSRVSPEYGCVYDQNEELDTFFPLSELQEGEKMTPERIDVNEVFHREGISLEDIGEDRYRVLLEDYQFLLSPFIRRVVESSFGVELSNFSVRTQVQFLEFLSKKNDSEAYNVATFLKNGNSENRLKSFLSLEQGGEEMGDVILSIGKKLPKEAADMVFAKYTELVDGTRSLEKTLSQYYPEQNHEEHVRSIGKQLLDRARNVLVRFSSLDADIDEGVILEKLSREQAGIAVFLAIHKTLRKEGRMPILEELPGVNFQVATNRDLHADQETLQKMRTVYVENYSAYPKEFREKVVGSLDERVRKDTVFYLLWKDGELLAFDAFTRQDDNTLSFGAFNIIPEAQGHALADGMLEATLLRHGKMQNIVAECDARKPISKKYVEYGFAVKGLYTARFPDGDVPILSIERRKGGEAFCRESDRNYERKELTVPLREWEETLQPLLSGGFIITRYDNSDLEHIACTLERSVTESD